MKMKAAVVKVQGEPMEIMEVNIRECQDNEVRIKLAGTGICHTDIAHAKNEWNMAMPMPMVMGHEGAGVVESVGPGVTKVKVGDHVIISNPSCGDCPQCAQGMDWFCAESANGNLLLKGIDFFGTTTMTQNDGTPVHLLFQQSSFAEYVVSNQRCITKIPEAIDLKLAGPIGCGMRTGAGAIYSVIQPRYGEWVIVNGSGTVGLSALWTAKAHGARVLVTDVKDDRLALAKETGADVTLNIAGMTDDEITAAMIEAMGGKAPHMVEASGVNTNIKAGMNAVDAGGQIAQVGVAGEMHFDSWFFGAVDMHKIQNVHMGNTANDVIIPLICDMYVNGKFPLDKILSFYKLEEIDQAMEDSEAGRIIKPVLLFD